MSGLSSRIGGSNHLYDPTSLINAEQSKQAADSIKISLGNANQDSVSFSGTGKKLNLIIRDKDKLTSANHWDPVLNGVQNPSLNTADEYIARGGNLLEQMLEITKEAKKNSLSDDERLALQTEIGRLQFELNVIGETLFMAPGIERDYKQHEQLVRAYGMVGGYENTLSYRMLRRAAGRVAAGGEWDVREIAHIGPWIKNEDGTAGDFNGIVEGVQEDYFGSTYQEISYNVQRRGFDSSKVGYIYEVTDDESVPTVGDILKNTGRSVMDSASASETAEELKRDGCVPSFVYSPGVSQVLCILPKEL